MSSHGTYVEGGAVHLDDVNGFPATIPARHLHVVANAANKADNERATYGLRTFHRDVLNGARDLLDGRDPCDQCRDAPGTEDMGDGKRFCPTCCSGAQGSHYDDKD